MGAKRVVTGRNGHFAPLECLLAKGLLSSAHGWADLPQGQWGNQGIKGSFILSDRYANGFASFQTPASSSDVIFTYPLAPPFKTQILVILFL